MSLFAIGEIPIEKTLKRELIDARNEYDLLLRKHNSLAERNNLLEDLLFMATKSLTELEQSTGMKRNQL
jgi:hypothetical protein